MRDPSKNNNFVGSSISSDSTSVSSSSYQIDIDNLQFNGDLHQDGADSIDS